MLVLHTKYLIAPMRATLDLDVPAACSSGEMEGFSLRPLSIHRTTCRNRSPKATSRSSVISSLFIASSGSSRPCKLTSPLPKLDLLPNGDPTEKLSLANLLLKVLLSTLVLLPVGFKAT